MNAPLQAAAAAGRAAGSKFFDAMRAADQQAAEYQHLKDFHYKVADALGFVETVESVGRVVIERNDDTIVDHVRAHTETALKHEADCLVFCDSCERYETRDSCRRCWGSGCGPGTALGAYEPCGDCAGDGRDHEHGYVYVLDAEHAQIENLELQTRVQELEAENASLREQIEDWQWTYKDDKPKVVQRD